MPAFSSDKRLKNIFWKTFTVPAPSCSPPHEDAWRHDHAIDGEAKRQTQQPKVPGQKRRGSDGEKGGQSEHAYQEWAG